MRVAVVACAGALISATLTAECITLRPTARQFLSHATDAARATGGSSNTVTVTAVLLGSHLHVGNILTMPPVGCCPGPAPGVDYYLSAVCPSGSGCRWWRTDAAHARGFEQYLREKHVVSRGAVVEKLRAWNEYRLLTDDFKTWLATAEVDDDDTGPSLTLAVVEATEDLLTFLDGAESCQPGDAAWFRQLGSTTLLDRFERLPMQKTVSAYDRWLDAHPESADEWQPDRLRNDLEMALERDPVWKRATACVWKWDRTRYTSP